jgi:hypothetical protein
VTCRSLPVAANHTRPRRLGGTPAQISLRVLAVSTLAPASQTAPRNPARTRPHLLSQLFSTASHSRLLSISRSSRFSRSFCLRSASLSSCSSAREPRRVSDTHTHALSALTSLRQRLHQLRHLGRVFALLCRRLGGQVTRPRHLRRRQYHAARRQRAWVRRRCRRRRRCRHKVDRRRRPIDGRRRCTGDIVVVILRRVRHCEKRGQRATNKRSARTQSYLLYAVVRNPTRQITIYE